MDRYARLFDIARLLLSEEDAARTAENILRRVLELTGGHRGFIVVKEGKSYEKKFDLSILDIEPTEEDRKFSRTLVRQAIETKQTIVSHDLLADPRFGSVESVEASGVHAVFVVPLTHGGEVYGVVYIEHLQPLGGFDADAEGFLVDFAELAGLFVRRAVERDALRARSRRLEKGLFAQNDFQGIVTQSPEMLAMLRMVAQIADSDATVLIQGETGTGKELVARALHVNSKRAHRPLVVLHCTALPTTLLESELFGHVRGAFSGAMKDRAGRIAAAEGGTLFLDEIAEIPPELQAKLLRFLQFGEIQRLGSDRTHQVDVRVVAATHQNLEELVRAGKFREDLYYRLRVLDVEIPPLRDRRDDIPLLVDAFLREHQKGAPEPKRFTREAMAILEIHGYPGNVRELRHIVERACVLSQGDELGVDVLPPDVTLANADEALLDSGPPSGEDGDAPNELERVRRSAARNAERKFLTALIERCGGNISQAARDSGIHRSYLQRLMSKHGLRSTG